MDVSTSDGNAAESTFRYRRIVGLLQYISRHLRLDIAHPTSMLARNVEKPSMKHYIAAIKYFKYLNSTIGLGLVLKLSSSTKLPAHVHAKLSGEQGARERLQNGIVR